MPDDESVLSFSNRWCELGLKTAASISMNAEITISVLTPPFFVATKPEAFIGCGEGDFQGSRDIEDILFVIDGRSALLSEIAASPTEVSAYIIDQFEAILKNGRFENAVAGNLRDRGRMDLAFKRISESMKLGRHSCGSPWKQSHA